MNYRPMFVYSSGERLGNSQVFSTLEEAVFSAGSRFSTGMAGHPVGYAVDKTTDPVTCRWTDEGDVRLTLEEVDA